jgi:anti-sigma factor RsiW
MECQHVEELLPFYPRGDLPREAFAAVTRHLAGCPRCRRALADVQATYRLVQAHLNTVPSARPQAAARLVARLRAGRVAPPEEPPAGAAVPARRVAPAARLEAVAPEPAPDGSTDDGRDPGHGWWGRLGGQGIEFL